MKEVPFLGHALAIVIERLRIKRKMTKCALAEFAWLERRYLFEIEQGSKKPTVNAIYCLCEALQTSPSEFFQLVDAEMYRLSCSEEQGTVSSANTTEDR